MKIYVQLGEAPLSADERVQFRSGFRDFVETQGVSADNRVILIEQNPNLVPALQTLWRSVPNVEILNVHITPVVGESDTTFFSGEAGNTFPQIFAQDEEYVRRYFPSGSLSATQIATYPFGAWLTSLVKGSSLDVLSIDLRRSKVGDYASVPWHELPVETLILTTDGISVEEMKPLHKALKTAGFDRAGRSWGEAKTGETFRRSSASVDRLQNAISQLKVSAGQVAVSIRQGLPNDERRSAWKSRVQVMVSRSYSRADVLEPAFGQTLQPVNVDEVERAIENVSKASGREISILAETEASIASTAQECYAAHGIWPISFSYPKDPLEINPNPTRDLCSITPGFPYSFNDESEYLRVYADARLGLTHRKAGWDCFRHLEIMASGAAPLMLDAAEIPKYSMIHYPKQAFAEIERAIQGAQGIPDLASRENLRAYFTSHLTSKAMASYILKMSGLSAAQRVLFVDEQLPNHAEYLSVLTLIGLKQLMGSNCEVAFPVDYLFENTTVDISRLYGRGFGYTRVLPSQSRGKNEESSQLMNIESLDLKSFDVVVIGSVARNQQLADHLLKRYPSNQTIWINGEDSPPTIEEVRKLRNSGTHTFVRSISI